MVMIRGQGLGAGAAGGWGAPIYCSKRIVQPGGKEGAGEAVCFAF